MAVSFFPFSIHIVRGHSMQPTIRDGGHVVVFRWAYVFLRPRPGEIVVFDGADGKVYVKRVTAIGGDGCIVEGDNKGDSKGLPPIRRKALRGKCIGIFNP